MTPDLNVIDLPENKQSNPKALSFPLEVGKRWRYATDWLFKPKGSRGSIVVDVEVVAHERIEYLRASSRRSSWCRKAGSAAHRLSTANTTR